jgi:6-phosphogluconolactonase
MIERKVHIYKTTESLSILLAEKILNLIKDAINNGKDFNIAVSGGKTPVKLFQNIAGSNTDKGMWKHVNFYWADERCVPPEHPDSNFRLVYDTLLRHLDIPEPSIHRIRGEDNPVSEAKRYSDIIRTNVPVENSWPFFSLVILGMGSDGHTASIFPGQLELFSSDCICKNTSQPETGQQRITLTGNVINNARHIYILVTGNDKAAILARLFDQTQDNNQYPVHHIRPANGIVEWFIDKEAAKKLT